jgi:4-hydroxy 2-oxovalerate aldolase
MAGYETGIDAYKAMDAAEDILAPMLEKPPVIDKVALAIGVAGVYGSFALHAKKAAERYKIDVRDILMELGRRKIVGGQEDMIVEVAWELANRKK